MLNRSFWDVLEDDDTGMAAHGARSSIAHLETVSFVEEAFAIAFTSAEIADATSVVALRRLLKTKETVA